jgi:hypothetical protein
VRLPLFERASGSIVKIDVPVRTRSLDVASVPGTVLARFKEAAVKMSTK